MKEERRNSAGSAKAGRIISLICTAAVLLTATIVTVCAWAAPAAKSVTAAQSVSAKKDKPFAGKKILIAYFTRADNTAHPAGNKGLADATSSASLKAPGNAGELAAIIQKTVGGELFSIQVQHPYNEDYNKVLERANEEELSGARPVLKGPMPDLNSYDIIFLGYPNWCYNCQMAVLSFLEQAKLKGKTILPFCVHGSGELAKSIQSIRAAAPNNVIGQPLGISRGEMGQAVEKVSTWLAETARRQKK